MNGDDDHALMTMTMTLDDDDDDDDEDDDDKLKAHGDRAISLAAVQHAKHVHQLTTYNSAQDN